VADLDANAGCLDVDAWPVVAVVAVTVRIMVANNDAGIGMVDALGNAGPVIADLPAITFGIGGVGQDKPQSGRGGAD
jgi:hypothetical protein